MGRCVQESAASGCVRVSTLTRDRLSVCLSVCACKRAYGCVCMRVWVCLCEFVCVYGVHVCDCARAHAQPSTGQHVQKCA